MQSSDQLLVKIAAFGQRPAADAIEHFPAEREAGVESAGGVLQLVLASVRAQHAGWF